VTLSGLPSIGVTCVSEEFEGIVRVKKWGNSMVLVLPVELREFFGLVPRDILAFRKVGRYVMIRRIRAGELVPLSEQEARQGLLAVEKLNV
jgi:antitoxin component of MazEF toxin-antitoxin module